MPRARVVLIYRKLALWLDGKARESLMEPSADQEGGLTIIPMLELKYRKDYKS